MNNTLFKKKEYDELKCYIINLKIHSDEVDKEKLYSDLIEQVFNLNGFYVKIGTKFGLDLKKLDKLNLSKKDLGVEYSILSQSSFNIFTGEFVKFKIEDENDKYYNTISKELKPGDPNSIDKPNAIQIPFYFVPLIHRFFLPVKSNVTVKQVAFFFEKALLEIYEKPEFFNIDIAKSTEEIEKIYEFESLKKIEITVSYTNDDLGDDAKQFMDLLLKEANTNTYKGEFKAEKNDSLNMESQLIKGGIELSKENGDLVATGENNFGNQVVVNTKSKFEEFALQIKKDVLPVISILKQTLKKWRL
ncbi:DUF4747 family protein [Sphingobacterium siyangense]|uniref:DUF4747 family protein n=1 Tax=Sphingobacterium siyangense TaxID=459529 RepID=UPI00200EE319|nr:DUF4747 family protein [Sphingobacterium siyangense]UQA76721.1 DUF4747 family protein [Sphingobacterium siyangense]